MNVVKVSFDLSRGGNVEQIQEYADNLTSAWRMNGQASGNEFPQAKTLEQLEVFLDIPEANALDECNSNKYVRKYLEKLKAEGAEPSILQIGSEPYSWNICKCEFVKAYILFTTYTSLETPLKCLKCFGVVPLYGIPKTYDDEYYDIICWKSDYQSCDSLQMNCQVGERFAINQMSKIDSQLSKLGLKARGRIEEVTKTKVYYYLYRTYGKSHESEIARKCPNCGGEWFLKKPLHNRFDFKCKKCRLLSNISWNFQ